MRPRFFYTIHRRGRHSAYTPSATKSLGNVLVPEQKTEIELVRKLKRMGINLKDYEYHSRGDESFLVTTWKRKSSSAKRMSRNPRSDYRTEYEVEDKRFGIFNAALAYAQWLANRRNEEVEIVQIAGDELLKSVMIQPQRLHRRRGSLYRRNPELLTVYNPPKDRRLLDVASRELFKADEHVAMAEEQLFDAKDSGNRAAVIRARRRLADAERVAKKAQEKFDLLDSAQSNPGRRSPMRRRRRRRRNDWPGEPRRHARAAKLGWRRRKHPRRLRRKGAWMSLVKKYGVRKAAKLYRKRPTRHRRRGAGKSYRALVKRYGVRKAASRWRRRRKTPRRRAANRRR